MPQTAWRSNAGHHRLAFATGVREHNDYPIYDEIIDAYVRRGQPIEAIHLAMRSGELMMGETTPFRERSAFTPEKHRARLRELFLAANLPGRAALLRPVESEKTNLVSPG